MCSERAGSSLGVIFITEIIFVGKPGIVMIGREHQRSAALPAADKFRSQQVARHRIADAIRITGGLIKKVPELGDMLSQLAEHQISAVASKIVHSGCTT